MIVPEHLYHFLREQGIIFYTGVPDSLMRSFLAYVQENSSPSDHIITANEGLAIGLATGYHLRTGKVPVVYLQNSGLGNIINPLTSLADKEMYGIPMILLIGWRGKPGTSDEPQHAKMGRVTKQVLETLEIPVYELEGDPEISFKKIAEAIAIATREQKPVALLLPENIFGNYELSAEPLEYNMVREEVIRTLLTTLSGDEVIVCTTGKSGREFYEQNKAAGEKFGKYFLSVGAMGHANHIALGLGIDSCEKIVMLDADGALLMQMGSLPTIAHHIKSNFIHIVINNGCHESVGGQPTEGFFADCCAIAKASGYPHVTLIRDEEEWSEWLKCSLDFSALKFVEIRVSKQSRAELGRPEGLPSEWKTALMNAINKKGGE